MIIRKKNEENDSLNTRQKIIANVSESNEYSKQQENDPSFECFKSGSNLKRPEVQPKTFDSKNKDKSINQKTSSKFIAKDECNEEAINNPNQCKNV